MNIHVVLVNGAPESGKTSFEKMCQVILGPYYHERSTVSRVKELAKECGWDGIKDAAGRRFLSDMKDALTRYNDMPFNDIIKTAGMFERELCEYSGKPQKGVLFVDVREPEEIERLKQATNGVTIFLDRETEHKVTSNHADANVKNYRYDYYIDNNGTFAELEEKASKFLKDIGAI